MRAALNVTFAIVIAAVLTVLMLQYSAREFRLLIAPTYDDVVYFNDAATRLETLGTEGSAAMVREMFEQPPHASVATVLAMLAFSVAGLTPAAAYAMQGVLVALVMLTVVWLVRRSPWWLVLAALVVAAAPRTCMIGIIDFRPDFALAVFLAIGTVRLCVIPLERASRGSLLLTGLSFAMALLSKPTMFPMVLWMLGVAGGTAVASVAWRRDTKMARRAGIQITLWLILPMAIVAAPYSIAAGDQIGSYIHANLFGSNREFWTVDRGWSWHLMFYLTGDGSNTVLGPHRIVLPILAVVGAILALRRGSRLVTISVAQWVIAIGASLAMPTFVTMKIPHFGMTSYLLLAFAGTAALREVNAQWRGNRQADKFKLALVVGVALLAAALSRTPRGWSFEPSRLKEHADVQQRIYTCIAEHVDADAGPVIVTTAGYLNSGSLRWMSLQSGDRIQFATTTFLPNEAEVLERLKKASAVVASHSVSWGMNANLPGTQMQGATFGWLSAQDEFEEVCRVGYEHGGQYAVFVRREK